MMKIVRINHIAFVHVSMDEGLKFWRDVLGLPVSGMQNVPQEKVQVAFLPLGNTHLEIVEPLTDDTGVAKFLRKRGPGFHHICLEVTQLDRWIAHLKDKGVRLIHEEPQISPRGFRYVFLHPKSTGGVLVELYEQLQESK